MALKRMDNVGIVVDDIGGAIDFFGELGLELNASLADVIASVRAAGLEGLMAKRLDSRYEPGQRSGTWQKMRINQGRIRGTNAQWLHAGVARATLQAVPRAGDRGVPRS